MLKYLLDTNIAIYVINKRPHAAKAIFAQQHGHMAISSISVAELWHGAEKSQNQPLAVATIEDFCARLTVLDYGPKAAAHYGHIRASLEKQGLPIGVNDLHIAAHARSEGLTLVSNNLREFDRVNGLLTDNWITPSA
jgi:tRNA(fMet)-specific endonuclease VapC